MTVSTPVLTEYRKQRKAGAHPANALDVARRAQEPDWPMLEPDDDGGHNARFTVAWEGFDVVVTVRQEEFPDVSHLGYFTDRWEPGAIKNSDWRPRMHGSDSVAEWFVPSRQWGTDEDNEPYLVRAGLARHDRWLTLQGYLREDERACRGGDEWPQWIITAQARKAGVVLGEDLVGGFDMGPDWHPHYLSDDDLHALNMAAADVIHAAVGQAHEKLAELATIHVNEPSR